MKWYLKVLRHYADFGGRAQRKEFWYFVLFNFIAAIVAMAIDTISGWELTVNSSSGLPSYGPCYLTYAVAALLPSLAVAVRRLHDLGKSGWMLLVALIPIVGGIWLLILFCKESEDEQNRYGADPQSVKQYFPGRKREKSIAIAFIVGAAILLANVIFNRTQSNIFAIIPFWFWVIPALTIILILLFGIFYYPSDDSGKTANRRNIAFILLAVAMLISVVRNVFTLGMPDLFLVNRIIALLQNLALLALSVLLLVKSEQKNIKLVSVLTISFTVLSIVLPLVQIFIFHNFHSPFGIILDIAVILLATHCLQRKTVEEESPLISLRHEADENVVYQPSSPLATAESQPSGGSGKSLGWKIFGLFISIGLIIGGLSGEMVLRGTESSTALVAVGVLFLIADIIALATHNKSVDKKKEYEQLLADGVINSVELDAPATIMVVRDSSIIGAIVPYKVYLNHDFVGKINNGKSLEIKTSVSHNIITVFDNNDNAFSGDFTTSLNAGDYAEVRVKAGRFVKK